MSKFSVRKLSFDEEIPSSLDKPKQRKSGIYQRFVWNEEKKKFQCKHCKDFFIQKSKSTGNLWKHYNRCTNQLIANSGQVHTANASGRITKFFKPQLQGFDKDELENRLLDFVIMTDQPFSILEDPSFIAFAIYGRPIDGLFSSTTLKRRLLQRYESEKAELKSKLKEAPGKISLITDCWTSKNCISFNGIIASWINSNWEYEEYLLDLAVLQGKHTGKNLANSLIKVLEDYEILNKISTITTDNASNNISMLKEFEEILAAKGLPFDIKNQHVKCLAHIVNLACKDAMSELKKISVVQLQSPVIREDSDCDNDSVTESDSEKNELESDEGSSGEEIIGPGTQKLSIYQRVRVSIRKIRRSTQLRESFYGTCQLKKIKHKQLVLDNQVRWNTGYYMYQRLLEMREPYEVVVRSEKQLENFKLEESEWRLISEIVTFLKPFYDMTMHMSKAKTPSMALSAAVYIELYNHLESYNEKSNKSQEILAAAEAACNKLNKYYPDSDGLAYILGLLLDPRCKHEWYKSVGIHADIVKRNKSVAVGFWDQNYKPQADSQSEAIDFAGDILASQMKRKRLSKHDEFRQYLALPPVEKVPNNDILCWWKDHEQSFPAVAVMARDFLAASGTGVPIERTFSYGPDLLGVKRLSMVGDTIRKCFSLKAWKRCKRQDFNRHKMFAIAKSMAGC